MLKKVICFALSLALVMSLGLAAQAEAKPLAGATFEIATRLQSPAIEELRKAVADFNAETGANAQLTEYPDADYENAMKTRMASGEMPDVFETHGWSRLRYGDYLMPVNDMEWYDEMNDLAKGILTGDGDTAYGLMMSTSLLGICCNKTAAEACGVDIYAIKTLDDFVAACQKIIDAGLVPLVNYKSAGDLTHIGGIFTTYDDAISTDMAAQLDGTWDWESFKTELDWWAKLLDMGACWEDRGTMTASDTTERVSSGKSVFYFANDPVFLYNCSTLNPDNEYALIPLPAATADGHQYFAGGEGYTIGIYNETKQKDACIAYLDYMSKNCAGILSAGGGIGGIPALKSTVVPESFVINICNDAMAKYPDARYVNMWDREYMPSGMWPVFGEAAGMMYADNSPENLAEINEFLKENYVEKYEAAHN